MKSGQISKWDEEHRKCINVLRMWLQTQQSHRHHTHHADTFTQQGRQRSENNPGFSHTHSGLSNVLTSINTRPHHAPARIKTKPHLLEAIHLKITHKSNEACRTINLDLLPTTAAMQEDGEMDSKRWRGRRLPASNQNHPPGSLRSYSKAFVQGTFKSNPSMPVALTWVFSMLSER